LSLLPADVTHYLIPFTDVVSKFMEVLEVGEFTGKGGTAQEIYLVKREEKFCQILRTVIRGVPRILPGGMHIFS
jgi:hypothetical protein